MRPTQWTVTALRILLILAFALLVVFQVLSLPGQFAHMAKEDPDNANLRWPLTLFSVLLLVCVQVVIVSTWKLLTMVKDDRIFSHDALRWVDLIVWAVGAAWVMVLAAFLYFAFTWGDPGIPILLLLFVVGGAALSMLLLVIRALLRQATTLRTDMEAVI